MRPPVAACAAASSTDAGGRGGLVDRGDAGHRSNNGDRARPAAGERNSAVYRIEAVERTDPEAVVLRAVEAELGRAVSCTSRTRRRARSRPPASWTAPAACAASSTRTCSACTARARSTIAPSRSIAGAARHPPRPARDRPRRGDSGSCARSPRPSTRSRRPAPSAPPLTLERIWVDERRRRLPGRARRPQLRATRRAAALARLLGALDPRPSRPLDSRADPRPRRRLPVRAASSRADLSSVRGDGHAAAAPPVAFVALAVVLNA